MYMHICVCGFYLVQYYAYKNVDIVFFMISFTGFKLGKVCFLKFLLGCQSFFLYIYSYMCVEIGRASCRERV